MTANAAQSRLPREAWPVCNAGSSTGVTIFVFQQANKELPTNDGIKHVHLFCALLGHFICFVVDCSPLTGQNS